MWQPLSRPPWHMPTSSQHVLIVADSVPVRWSRRAPPLPARPGSPPPASVSELPRWLGGGPQSRWTDGAGAGSGGTRFWSCGLPGELPSEKTVTREEAESFAHWSTGAWTRAAQVICHLLMGLINGRRVERGGFLPTASRSIQGLQGDCIFFSAVDAAFHR